MSSMLIEQERKHGEAVIPAIAEARKYVDWFMEETTRPGANPDEVMQLIIQHTQDWGIACLIDKELERFAEMEKHLASHKGTFAKKQLTQDERNKLEVLRIVFLAKLLREIFIKDTNFTEVAYGE